MWSILLVHVFRPTWSALHKILRRLSPFPMVAQGLYKICTFRRRSSLPYIFSSSLAQIGDHRSHWACCFSASHVCDTGNLGNRNHCFLHCLRCIGPEDCIVSSIIRRFEPFLYDALVKSFFSIISALMLRAGMFGCYRG